MQVYSTVSSMVYVDEINQLVTAGQGFLKSYEVRRIEFGVPLEEVKEPFHSELISE